MSRTLGTLFLAAVAGGLGCRSQPDTKAAPATPGAPATSRTANERAAASGNMSTLVSGRTETAGVISTARVRSPITGSVHLKVTGRA